MIDSADREIDYIRISVTDRCNLRCIYCMPAEGIPKTDHESILSFDEIERLCRILAKLGFKKVKLTGGEPLVRKNLVELVRRIKKIRGIETVTLTTNGILLADMMDDLAGAGIDAVNISLDTMNPEVFTKITRYDLSSKVLDGIHKALAYEHISIKINCVPLGIAIQDLIGVALLARDHNIHVRFIEMMPIGYGKNFTFLSEEEIVSLIEERFGTITRYEERLGNGPGHYYSVAGFTGKIGFISAISHQFCNTCNRVRLTAVGYLKTCLQYENGCDLKQLLRSGSSDKELEAEIIKAINEKPRAHHFLSGDLISEEQQMMSQIGG